MQNIATPQPDSSVEIWVVPTDEGRVAARGAAARERKCRSLSLQLRWREEDLRDATLKEDRKARVRARRAAEKLAQECQ